MKRFVLTPRAKQDVNDIWDYIADDSIEAADRVLEGRLARLLRFDPSFTLLDANA